MADRTSTVRVNVVTDASGAGVALGKFGRVAGAAALGVGALAVGAAVGVNKLATLADVSDDANAKIENVVKTMGLFKGAAAAVSQRIEDYAKKTSQATAVDINSIKATQAKLLTFKALAKTAGDTGGAFDRATKAAVDMAALGFGTAEQNAVQLGKALQDPANGLTALKKTGALTADQIKAIGDEFKRTGDISKAQADILKAVEVQVGGTAEATAGGFELMKNRVSIFANELGAKLLPYLDRFGTFMIETGGPALLKFGKAMSEKVLPVLKQLGTFIGEQVIPRLVELVGWINENVVPVMKGALTDALEGAKGLFKNVAKAIGDNGPELKDMGDKLKKVAEFVLENVVPVFSAFMRQTLPALGTAIGIGIGYISGLWNAWNSVWDILKKIATAIQTVIDKINAIPALPDLPGGSESGGKSNPVNGDDFRTSGRGNVDVHVHLDGKAYVGDEAGLARMLQRVLRDDALRFNGLAVS